MSPDEYKRVYKNYIQLSALLGYPFLEGSGKPCDHALRAIFRQSGLFGYPVPPEATSIARRKFSSNNYQVETYELGGISIQVVREGKSSALDRLILVNSSSPKATRKLSEIFRKEILTLERDSRTGLEKVKGLPVGFPHPMLTPESQGLFVKILRFNHSTESCEPVAFYDNTWVGGFDLTADGCRDLQHSVEQVWHGNLSDQEFAKNQVTLMKQHALKSALAHGVSEEEAQKIVSRSFVPPLTSDVNVIGNSMRNLAECNSLALGAGDKKSSVTPNGPAEQATPGAGSAQ